MRWHVRIHINQFHILTDGSSPSPNSNWAKYRRAAKCPLQIVIAIDISREWGQGRLSVWLAHSDTDVYQRNLFLTTTTTCADGWLASEWKQRQKACNDAWSLTPSYSRGHKFSHSATEVWLRDHTLIMNYVHIRPRLTDSQGRLTHVLASLRSTVID